MTKKSYLAEEELRRLQQIGRAAMAFAVVGGAVLAGSVDALIGYIVVLVAASLPFFTWVQNGGQSTPILPVAAFVYIPYYAFGAINGTVDHYTPSQVLTAELTVASFLVAAWGTWRPFLTLKPAQRLAADRNLNVDATMPRLVFSTLFFGLLFDIGNVEGWWLWLGSSLVC